MSRAGEAAPEAFFFFSCFFVIRTKKNIHKFLNSLEKKKYKKETDLYLGFFGYEILCNLIGINLKNKKRINFYKGIFYKPETIIKIRKDIKVISNIKKHLTYPRVNSQSINIVNISELFSLS